MASSIEKLAKGLGQEDHSGVNHFIKDGENFSKIIERKSK